MNWRVVVLLVLCRAIRGTAAQAGCPPLETILPCRCLLRGEEYQIWCSHSDLPRVLDGLHAVGQQINQPIDELILENNFLPALPGRAFVPLKVMRLMLRYNGLERVSNDWLAGLGGSLMELFIVEPQLRSLPDDSLLGLDSLEAITIQTNQMKRLPLIVALPKLRYLQVESLGLQELSPRNLKDNPVLQRLHISMSPRLQRLEADTFRDLPNLIVVNISYCGVAWVHPRAFTNLPALKEVSLVGNKIEDAGMVGRASRGLPELEVLRLDHNYIDKIGEAAFVDLPALKMLFLSENRIQELNHGGFHRVPQLRKLDLNRNSLRRVHPESFLQHSGSGLEELWLVENDIEHVAELRSLLDALPRLTFLDMSYNALEAIPFGALRGHPTLEYLHLDYNKIHMIDREAFMAMPALRELRLRNNSLSDSLGGPLWNLPSLKGLDLAGNYYRRLDADLLGNLPSLRRFDVSGNDVGYIDPTVFLPTPELEHVNLSSNALGELHPATFRHLLGLYELDLGGNRLGEFVPGLPRGVEYLHLPYNRIATVPQQPSPDLDLPSLRHLDLSHNKIETMFAGGLRSLPQLRRLYLTGNLLGGIPREALDGLTRLETLKLDRNRLHTIDGAFHQLTELRVLNLQDNDLENLPPNTFMNTPNLRILSLGNNKLKEIPPGAFDKTRNLQILDLSNNNLQELPQTIFGLNHLQHLDLTNNLLKHLDPQILNTLASLQSLKASQNKIPVLKRGALSNLHHLTVLNLDRNDLEVIEPSAIRNLPLLKTLKLSRNKLRELPNAAFSNLPLLQVAELQENQLRHLAPGVFTAAPHLLALNLSHNQLTGVEDSGLRTLRSLEMLDLSGNRLSRMAAGGLEKMEWLVELRMDDNEICGVQGSFNSMPRLRVLTARNNKMMTFPEEAVHRLRGNLAVLDIEGNPLVCSCNLLWLQAWLQETSSQGPRCVDGTLVREMRLSRHACTDDERNMDIVAPGCEAELLSVPPGGVYGTSQVFAPWMKLRTNETAKQVLAPSPEESEYFYDEFVDYPYNDTEQNNLGSGHFINNNNNNDVKVLVEISTKSPHFTTGDTPTIYAAPKKNITKTNIPKEIVNSPSTSGFTFFGVPLPPLNFNSLLKGTGRMEGGPPKVAQRKIAIVNKGPMTQMRPPPPPRQRIGGGPPNFPDIQRGGFMPILPGSGGFTPIINPDLRARLPENSTTTTTTTTLPPTTTIVEEQQNLTDRKIDASEGASKVIELITEAVVEEIVVTEVTMTTEPVTTTMTTTTTTNDVTTVTEIAEITTGPTFLAPGALQPQVRPAGRSTITKVTSPHVSLVQAQVSEPLKSNREAKLKVPDVLDGDPNDWYFANYNKSGGEDVNRAPSGATTPLTPTLKITLTLIYLLVKLI